MRSGVAGDRVEIKPIKKAPPAVADVFFVKYEAGLRCVDHTIVYKQRQRGGEMTADGHFRVPTPVNEPVRQYTPGDPNRNSLKARLAELTDARTEVPMQIGGERRWGASRADIRSPHRKELSIAEGAFGARKDFADAIDAALEARRMWAATSYQEMAAVLLRAASLLAGPWGGHITAP